MKIFNIRDYGAKICDRLQTDNIQKAIDDCFLAGGGRVVIPCGVYVTGGGSLAAEGEYKLDWVRNVWELPLRRGVRRSKLFLLSVLLLL